MEQSNIKLFIKIVLYIISILGIILVYGNIKGWFIQKERLDLYNKLITDPYKIERNYPSVEAFLKEFYNPSKANSELRSVPIKGIKSTWITIGNNKPMAGNVHLWLEGGRQSTSLCTLDELNDWAKQRPFYKWLSLALLAIGVLGRIIIDVYPSVKKEKITKT